MSLEHVAVGDQVVVLEHGKPKNLARVERVLKRWILLEGSTSKFSRTTGGSVGAGPWARMSIQEATPALVEEVTWIVSDRQARAILWRLHDTQGRLHLALPHLRAALQAVELKGEQPT